MLKLLTSKWVIQAVTLKKTKPDWEQLVKKCSWWERTKMSFQRIDKSETDETLTKVGRLVSIDKSAIMTLCPVYMFSRWMFPTCVFYSGKCSGKDSRDKLVPKLRSLGCIEHILILGGGIIYLKTIWMYYIHPTLVYYNQFVSRTIGLNTGGGRLDTGNKLDLNLCLSAGQCQKHCSQPWKNYYQPNLQSVELSRPTCSHDRSIRSGRAVKPSMHIESWSGLE